jgi:hypothetical protein
MKNIALFISTHETLMAEKLFQAGGIVFKTVIKPRNITSECGMGLEFDGNDQEIVLKICRENNLRLIGIFFLKENGVWEKI